MPSNIWFSSIANGANTDIFISASTVTQYTGSGTPWTSQGTTPFRIGMNDVTGQRWTPTAAPSEMVFGAGPPFLEGSPPLYDAYGNVVETIPIQCYASSLDNAIGAFRYLREILNTGIWAWPVTLAVQPNTATGVVYFEVYKADVQENPLLINDEAGRKMVRATITITRSPRGLGASLGTLLNSVTFTNNGTGANNNTQLFGVSGISATTTDGDFVYQGQPINIKITPAASVVIGSAYLYVASVLSRTYTSVATAKTTSTTTSYFAAGSEQRVTLDIATYYILRAAKMRILGRFTTFTALSKAQFSCTVYDYSRSTSGATLYTSPWIDWTQENNSASTIQIDFGYIDLSFLRRHLLGTTAPQLSFNFFLKSSDGTSVTATLDYFEILQYYDFCRIGGIGNGSGASGSTPTYLMLEEINNLNGEAYVLSRPPVAYVSGASNDQPTNPHTIRGRVPRAYAGASLYLSWLDGSFQHTKTETATVLVTMGKQYRTLRGAG